MYQLPYSTFLIYWSCNLCVQNGDFNINWAHWENIHPFNLICRYQAWKPPHQRQWYPEAVWFWWAKAFTRLIQDPPPPYSHWSLSLNAWSLFQASWVSQWRLKTKKNIWNWIWVDRELNCFCPNRTVRKDLSDSAYSLGCKFWVDFGSFQIWVHRGKRKTAELVSQKRTSLTVLGSNLLKVATFHFSLYYDSSSVFLLTIVQ